jgi:RNA polymerase sigma-B factor
MSASAEKAAPTDDGEPTHDVVPTETEPTETEPTEDALPLTAREEQRALSRQLFTRLNEVPADAAAADPAKGVERQQLRDELVALHLPLVEHLARRFRNRGEPYDDLVQVGTIGLIKAVDRFDTERGVEFSTYATPTVVGEIKRHFRDKGWAVRVPRRLQDLRLQLTAATQELSQSQGRSPTVGELALHLGISEDDVLEGLESANAYATISLDAGGEAGEDEGLAMLDTLGSEDEALEGVEYRESLKPLLAALDPRERRILLLRFFRNMTQSEIATEIGISQMHVSRLLARTLAQLREGLLRED